MDALNGGRNALSNEEFVTIIENAIASHKQWMKKLESIVSTMTVTPLQTDGNRCGFGHFYKSIDVYNIELSSLWQQIDSVHKTLHENGGKVISAVKSHNEEAARQYFKESTVCAAKILEIFEEIVVIVKKNENKKIQIFQNDIKAPVPVNILT
jgi:predicted heme/steroid binding protein